MYGPMWPFYSCMGLMISDMGVLWVDGLSMDPRVLGRHRCGIELHNIHRFSAG